jgi:hypothetical protein
METGAINKALQTTIGMALLKAHGKVTTTTVRVREASFDEYH